MNISDLSAKSRTTLAKIAKAKGVRPCDVLKYIDAISSCRKVSRHFSTGPLLDGKGV